MSTVATLQFPAQNTEESEMRTSGSRHWCCAVADTVQSAHVVCSETMLSEVMRSSMSELWHRHLGLIIFLSLPLTVARFFFCDLPYLVIQSHIGLMPPDYMRFFLKRQIFSQSHLVKIRRYWCFNGILLSGSHVFWTH